MLIKKFLRISTGLLLVSGLAVGCTLGPASYEQNIQSSVSHGIVRVNVRDDGTVILHGWVEDYYSKQQAGSAARHGEGITRVINNLHVIN